MKEKTYWILRLLISGIGLGIFAGLVISQIAGIMWIIAYSLCWVFSYIRILDLTKSKKLRRQNKKS